MAWAQTNEEKDSVCDTIVVDRAADDFVTASLLIAEPCGVLYSVMGHAALRLQCPTYDLDYVFSYESESAEEKVLAYLAGRLRMGLFPIPIQEYLDNYAQLNRGVKEYILNLPPATKQELWRICDMHVEEGKNLPFDYVKRGCAIACVHLLNEALHGAHIDYAEWPEKFEMTRRELGAESMKPYPWSKFVIVTLVGTNDYDKQCPKEEKLIIPADLADVWSKASYHGQPLVAESHDLIPFTNPPMKKGMTPTMLAALMLALAIGNLFIKKPYIDWGFLGVQTLAGVFFTYLLFFSKLPCADWFWVYVIYNPLPAIFWPWRRYWAVPYCGIIAAWVIAMAAYPHMLVEPAHVLFALAFCMIVIKNSSIYEKCF